MLMSKVGLFRNFGMVTAATPVHPCRSRVPKCTVDCVDPSHSHTVYPTCHHRRPNVLEFWNSDCVTTHVPLLFTLSKMYRRYYKLLIYVTWWWAAGDGNSPWGRSENNINNHVWSPWPASSLVHLRNLIWRKMYPCFISIYIHRKSFYNF